MADRLHGHDLFVPGDCFYSPVLLGRQGIYMINHKTTQLRNVGNCLSHLVARTVNLLGPSVAARSPTGCGHRLAQSHSGVDESPKGMIDKQGCRTWRFVGFRGPLEWRIPQGHGALGKDLTLWRHNPVTTRQFV
jgi:hypothetical protein